MEEIRKQLQCRSCKRPLFPPILMCEKGESVCQECRTKYDKCPLCKKNFTQNKNEALETLAKIPCFICNKCSSPLKLVELREHYAKCLQNEGSDVRCPIERCKWVGHFRELPAHWRSKKLALHSYIEENICKTKSTKYSYFVNMVEAHDSVFFFKSMCREGSFFWALQYVGDENKAEDFLYEVEIFNPTRVECKFIVSSYCQSIEIEKDDLFKEGVCIYTPNAMVGQYLTEDKDLLYNFRVRKVNKVQADRHRKKVERLVEKHTKK